MHQSSYGEQRMETTPGNDPLCDFREHGVRHKQREDAKDEPGEYFPLIVAVSEKIGNKKAGNNASPRKSRFLLIAEEQKLPTKITQKHVPAKATQGPSSSKALEFPHAHVLISRFTHNVNKHGHELRTEMPAQTHFGSVTTASLHLHIAIALQNDIRVVVIEYDGYFTQFRGSTAGLWRRVLAHQVDQRLNNGVVRGIHLRIQRKSALAFAIERRVPVRGDDPVLPIQKNSDLSPISVIGIEIPKRAPSRLSPGGGNGDPLESASQRGLFFGGHKSFLALRNSGIEMINSPSARFTSRYNPKFVSGNTIQSVKAFVTLNVNHPSDVVDDHTVFDLDSNQCLRKFAEFGHDLFHDDKSRKCSNQTVSRLTHSVRMIQTRLRQHWKILENLSQSSGGFQICHENYTTSPSVTPKCFKSRDDRDVVDDHTVFDLDSNQCLRRFAEFGHDLFHDDKSRKCSNQTVSRLTHSVRMIQTRLRQHWKILENLSQSSGHPLKPDETKMKLRKAKQWQSSFKRSSRQIQYKGNLGQDQPVKRLNLVQVQDSPTSSSSSPAK
ncbi:unnamed protein product [Notodromas monacha]|uniref:Uncharacterized protein n=1 Tax=Notodromas monacha TaxID=399045 RepID=A0A7R9GB99_9CRUS|nr:unnamed protein product [Notodromas monacha]CAG0916126.1 unnamed protein product [Notodromas monacha]